jgi:hypothetical protein
MRAPIFYDSNNTAYFIDPTGSTSLRIVGDIRMDSAAWSGEFNGKIQYHSSHWYVQGADFFFYRNAGGANVFSINQVGTVVANADMRAPIFYDNNNTGFYFDGASTTNVNAMVSFSYQGNGNVGGTGSASWHPSGIYSAGYNWLYGGINAGGASVTNMGDARANIFYDNNDTGYYADFNSTGDSIRAAGNIIAYFSDDRLKTKFGNITNAIDKVRKLNGFYYEANETAQKFGYKVKREVGVSAQELQAVLPEVVKDAPIGHGYLTVDYERVVPLLIEAIKELTAKVEALEAR